MKPPVINLALLVALSTSTNKFLAETANARLEVDPTARDPLTALGECADAVSYCYAPPLLGITECLASVRHCETETPWLETLPCCPKACVTAFSAELQAGQSEMQALETVFFREPDCFPGVRAALEAK